MHKGTWAYDVGPRIEAWMGTPHSGEHSPGTKHVFSKQMMRKITGDP